MLTILVVEDRDTIRDGLSQALREKGYQVIESADGKEALDKVQENAPDVIITDLKMPRLNGLELLKEVKKRSPNTYVVVITAYGSVESAVEAMKAGAFDYITKPFSVEEMHLLVKRIEEYQRMVDESDYLRRQVKDQYNFDNIVGATSQMLEVYKLIAKVANSDSAVLIRGESGTGKELVAGAIHYQSPRRDKPFIKVSCAALPETLLETELFGHERGAFTGARAQRKGRFELANGGTFFLDDIGDIPPSTQVKLLRALQEKEFERVGGTETIKVDVRIITATHQNLEEAISQNIFREDLYYRLNVVSISLPPLREKKDDIPLLANHFLRRFARKSNKDIKGIDPSAIKLLKGYNWPGNVRELENVIERAVVIMGHEEILKPEYILLPKHDLLRAKRESLIWSDEIKLRSKIKDYEAGQILRALEETNWVQTKAAKLLGISRSSLQYKMEKLKLRRDN